MQTTSDDLPRRVLDALGRGSRSDRTLRLADAFAAALGAEVAGAQLPSLRTLAGGTGAHRNTVRAALELLADAGLVDRRAGGRYRAVGACNAISIVEPRAPWPWIGGSLEALVPAATRRLPLESIDPATCGLVLAAEIELAEVRARLPRAEVLGVGASVMVDVELGLSDAPAGARVRIEADAEFAIGVGQVIDRIRPDIVHAPTGPAGLVLVPVGAPAPAGGEVRRFRTAPGKTELLLIAARIAHHAAPPAAARSSASSNGRAARQ
jgi:DNA-binding transcriptional ArsR family regulator